MVRVGPFVIPSRATLASDFWEVAPGLPPPPLGPSSQRGRGLPRRRHQLHGPAWQRPARVIPDVPGNQIDRCRLALAGGAAQRAQHAPEWTVAPVKQHLHRVHDCPRRTWTPQFKPALRPVGQALIEVEGGRVQGALRNEHARVDLLGGRGKSDGQCRARLSC